VKRAGLFAIAFFTAVAAVAEDVEQWGFLPFSLSGTYNFLYRGFKDDFLRRYPDQLDEWEWYNRLTLNMTRSRFVAGLQINADAFDVSEGDLALEKKYLEYRGDAYLGTAGDFFTSFGRGTALSVLKTHEIYGFENQIDNTILGGRFRYSGDRFRTELLGGVIRNELTDTDDSVFGATGTYGMTKWLRVGASGVVANLEGQVPDDTLAGGIIQVSTPSRSIDFYCEYTGLSPDKPFPNGADHGYAEYEQLILQKWGLTLSAEHKVLRNFFFRYATPPILEDEAIEGLIGDFMVTDPEDQRAFKTRGDYTFPDGTIVYAAYVHFNDRVSRTPGHPSFHRVIDDVYAGGERLFSNGIHILGTIGRRYEEGAGYYRMYGGPTMHGGFQFVMPIRRLYSAELDYERASLDGTYVQYHRNKMGVTFARASLFSITGMWESSDLPGEVFQNKQTNFYAWQAEVKIKQHVIRLFQGDQRGGVKCSGGVCKYVPAFSGTRLEAIIRF